MDTGAACLQHVYSYLLQPASQPASQPAACLPLTAVVTMQITSMLTSCSLVPLQVQVLRNGTFLLADSADLVPGDVVVVQNGTLPADMALLRGECIVDENMLTGGY
jgi:magnesium-transporting ATPase (P-type)